MNVSEIFESLQGEGPMMGRPMLFIRLSGCNLSCTWCDTKYALGKGVSMSVEDVAQRIGDSSLGYVCWTGGEPLLQRGEVSEAIRLTPAKRHCLETNGTIPIPDGVFSFIAVSPKDLSTAPPPGADAYKFVVGSPLDEELDGVERYVEEHSIDKEKVFIQPKCSTMNDALEAGRALWEKCVEHGLSLSPRLHLMLFGPKRGV